MEIKHTKGPWNFYHSKPYIGVSGKDDYCIHEIKQNSDIETQIANAKLIASAPELLDFIIRQVNESNFINDADRYEAFELINKTIK